MLRRLLFVSLFSALALVATALLTSGTPAIAQLPGVSQVAASKPSFAPGETITITVVATDDNGELRISSDLPGSTLNVTGCSVSGQAAASGVCTGARTAVDGQGSRDIYVDTTQVDTNGTSEANLSVTLSLVVASCANASAVTVDADQPQNAGPDLVTINCIPNTPTPTPTLTPTPTRTATPAPSTTPVPPTPPPAATATPVNQVLSSGIQPPNTGEAGLK
jgi:hypothetical protein